MVMNPGHWTVMTSIEKGLFLDYFVLLPSEYYEASILTQEVSTPCKIGYKGLCRHYAYPNLLAFDSVPGTDGYIGEGSSRYPLTEYLTDEEMLYEVGENKIPLINDMQKKIYFDLAVSNPGTHVLIVTYITPSKEQSRTATISIEANTMDKGKVSSFTLLYILHLKFGTKTVYLN